MSSFRASGTVQELGGGRLALLQQLQRHLQRQRTAAQGFGVILIQLANLNRINTSAGYDIGHRASADFAGQLQDILRRDDRLCVLGDDLIGIVLAPAQNAGHVALAANRITQIASGIRTRSDDAPELEVRIGIAIYPEHGITPEVLLRSADLALETAVNRQASFAIYTPEESKQLTDDWALSREIALGLKDGEFELYFQPKVDAVTRTPCGAEALLRWNNPRLGTVPTQRFIDAADGTEQIDELTRHAMHSAARNAGAWPHTNLNIAVNLTPSVLESGSIAHELESVAAIWGIEMSRFTVEITENGVVAAGSEALLALKTLRNAGVRVSIDDFGTGNSSLAYLKDIPADELKIDKSFIMDMHQTKSSARLVRTIIDLAHSFGLTVVGEGVETGAIADRLQELECDVLQGFFFAKPMPQDAFVEYLVKHQPRAHETQ